MPPVQMGGHAATSHLVPALLPPHRNITNRRLAAVTALFFGCDTRRVSQCATGLPMKFVRKVGRDCRRIAIKQCLSSKSRHGQPRRKAVLKTHAGQTLRDCRTPSNRAKRLDCGAFTAALYFPHGARQFWSARTRPRFLSTRHVASNKAASCRRTPQRRRRSIRVICPDA